MNTIYLKARAKINLAIDIVGKRDDGYHEMNMVMQSISLYDGVLIKKVFKGNYLKLITNLSWLPVDDRNIAYKAAEYLIQEFNLNAGVFIELKKYIPISAGLGGGSADCAAVLRGMRSLFSLPLSDKDLMHIGKKFGADVPFCVLNGTAIATGIGEKLKSIRPIPPAYVLLVKPPVIVSTAEVFKRYDSKNITENEKPDIAALVQKIESRARLFEISKEFKNVLESVTQEDYPVIKEIKALMLREGAAGAMMSGSGATVFGLFGTKYKALNAAGAIKRNFPPITEIIVTNLYNKRW